jgi:D-serine deaminase-like pyridoxal phosphate-dependent protein
MQRKPIFYFELFQVVYSRVVSHPKSGIVTFDSGSKSVAAEVFPAASVLGYGDARFDGQIRALSPSEEHLPVDTSRLGDALTQQLLPRGSGHWLVPTHICPSVNLAETVVLVDTEHQRSGGDSKPVVCRVVSVAARARDMGWA